MTGLKRLSPPQSRKVNSLVKRECCNCDSGNCILLDDGEECVCPQLISYSLLCKWFLTAVLPIDKRFRKWGGIPTAITQNVKDLSCSTRSFSRPRIKSVVPSAARSLLQSRTASNTARTAGNALPVDRQPSA